MCGRYTLTRPESIPEFFEISQTRLPPRFNIAPTQDIPVVRLDREGSRRLDLLRWGLIPSRSGLSPKGAGMINARAESVSQKPSFRTSFRYRRCLIPADGFFEWRKEGRRRLPVRLRLEDGGLFAFAGLWDFWESPQLGRVESCTILTCPANELVAPVHDRMPVVLLRQDLAPWLDPRSEGERLRRLLEPWPAAGWVADPVSSRVNDPRNDDPSCLIGNMKEG